MTETLLTTTPDEVVVDENLDYLTELTKPGAKFDRTKYSNELDMYKDIAKGKWHSDQDITIKNRRLDELRADYTKVREENITKAKLEELIDKLSKTPETPTEPQRESEPTTMDPAKLDSLVQESYKKIRQTENETANYNTVVSKLKERYGDKYSNFYQKQLTDLNLTDQEAVALAKRSPQAFFRTFGLNEEVRGETFQAPPGSQQRAASFAPTSGQKRTWNYYQQLKQKDPQLYYDPKIAVQMQKDMVELGEAFKDGDYFGYGHKDTY